RTHHTKPCNFLLQFYRDHQTNSDACDLFRTNHLPTHAAEVLVFGRDYGLTHALGARLADI
ncbi:hypothetical protein, partial [Antarctobacter heliothermus]|uniref:hypothetical protein n=1 Tax=Antarctobacter heliothermus TaxID=74033 RepID=UPI001BAF709C